MRIDLRRLGFGLFGILGAFALVPTANADLTSPASFALTSDHCDGGCLVGGSAGKISVTDLGSGELQFEVYPATGFGIINTGGGGGLGASFGFNLTNPPASVTYSNLTSGFSVVNGTGPGNLTATNSNGGIHVDGFGFFDYGVNCDICGIGSTNPFFGVLSFDVTASGLTINSLTQSTGGSPNAYFVADIYSTLTGNTGPVDASVPNLSTQQTSIPEPASVAILGTALAGLGVIRRRRRRGMHALELVG
jgi:hypothetical protein